MNNKSRIFFAILNWGLGHATRSIPLMKYLLEQGHELLLGSDGRALAFLQSEFPDLRTYELPSYNVRYPSRSMTYNILVSGPAIVRAIHLEQKIIQQLYHEEKIDLIISDNRYGIHLKEIPSAIITHQIRIQGLQKFQKGVSRKIISRWINKFSACWIPDYTPPSITSSMVDVDLEIPKKYLGMLSDLKHMPSNDNFDVLAVLSGPEPQRTRLEEIVLAQLKDIPGNHRVVLGISEEQWTRTDANIIIQSFASRDEMSKLISNARIYVGRSGYSSIMDLLLLGKPAILIPTPGQPEQIFLGLELREKGWAVIQDQAHINLVKAIDRIGDISISTVNRESSYKEVLDEFTS